MPNTQLPKHPRSPNLLSRGDRVALGVGSWGVGSYQHSVDDAVEKPTIRLALVEQAICFAAVERDVPLVAIPQLRIPPGARCPPRSRACVDAAAMHAAAIDGHARRLVVFDAYADR